MILHAELDRPRPGRPDCRQNRSGSPRSALLPTRRAAGALAAAVLALVAPVALAQVPGAPPGHDRPGSDRLAVEPLSVESLGLTLLPPEEAHIQSRRIEGRTAVTLVDASEMPAWSLQIQPLLVDPPAAGQRPGPAGEIDRLLQTWQGNDVPFRILSNRPVRYGNRPGQLCYVEHEAGAGRQIVSGWLILGHTESEYLVGAMQILPEAFGRVSDMLERSFATMKLQALSDVAEGRRLRLDLGRAFLEGLTPERLQALVGPTRWYRHYLPAGASGTRDDTELGYFSVTFRKGPLGAIDPRRDERSYDPSELTPGLLVAMEGRYLDAGSGTMYDSQAFYWVAWDQSEEAWSIRGTRRGARGAEQTEAETGIRPPRSVGDPAGTITVITGSMNGATRDQRSWRVPETYLSQALRWGLGRLLPRDYRGPRVFSTYSYDSTAPLMSINLRVDRWEPLTDGSNGWKLTSKSRGDAEEIVSTYDAEGELIRRVRPDGPVTESIALEALHRLWKRKGLETGPTRR